MPGMLPNYGSAWTSSVARTGVTAATTNPSLNITCVTGKRESSDDHHVDELGAEPETRQDAGRSGAVGRPQTAVRGRNGRMRSDYPGSDDGPAGGAYVG